MSATHHTVIKVVTKGRDGAGPIPVSGLKVGDIVFGGVTRYGTHTPFNGTSAFFELQISVDGEIQQTATLDLSHDDQVFFICPAAPIKLVTIPFIVGL